MKTKRRRRVPAFCSAAALLTAIAGSFPSAQGGLYNVLAKEDVITLRVCNWEEYIDLGDWDEEERMELDNGVEILGERALYEEFEDWYYETYGKRVQVEYSCFGTNEDLYNQLTLGDTYDLVCPSDYMIMKLMAEGLWSLTRKLFLTGIMRRITTRDVCLPILHRFLLRTRSAGRAGSAMRPVICGA